MKKITLLIVAIIIAFALTILCFDAGAQTNGQVIQVKKGQWQLFVIIDTTGMHIPINDSTWILSPDTVLVWKVVVDTVKITVDSIVYKSYAVHDTINICPVSAPLVTIFTTQTLPAAVLNDGASGGITVGVKFTSSAPGYIRGLRFYKVTGNSGTHAGILYSSTGTILASMVYTETVSGWQTVTFTTAIPIVANTMYVAACYSAAGNYSNTSGGFTSAIVNTPLTGLASTTASVNGVYNYGNKFPTLTFQNSNYWTDAVFSISAK